MLYTKSYQQIFLYQHKILKHVAKYAIKAS
jgi:hypothetical protein